MVHTNTSVLSVYVVHITVFIGLGLDWNWIGFGIDESTEILIYSLTCGRPKSTST